MQKTLLTHLIGITFLGGAVIAWLARTGLIPAELQILGLCLFFGSALAAYVWSKYRAKRDPEFAREFDANRQRLRATAQALRRKQFQRLVILIPALILAIIVVALAGKS